MILSLFFFNFFFLSLLLFVRLPTLFFQAVQATFKVEEITTSCYRLLDDEWARRVAAMQVLNIADQSNKDLRNKLTEEERAGGVLTRLWRALKGRPRIRGSSCMMPMISCLLPKSK